MTLRQCRASKAISVLCPMFWDGRGGAVKVILTVPFWQKMCPVWPKRQGRTCVWGWAQQTDPGCTYPALWTRLKSPPNLPACLYFTLMKGVVERFLQDPLCPKAQPPADLLGSRTAPPCACHLGHASPPLPHGPRCPATGRLCTPASSSFAARLCLISM